MVNLHELAPPPGSKRRRKRVGRGPGSGHGRYSCRGMKGQKSRSGGGVRPGFEGGQLPLVKRLARKPGFTNIFRIECSVVNVGDLNVFEANTTVSSAELSKANLVSSTKKPIKILGAGELKHPLTVKASKFSKVAAEKIQAAGGIVQIA